MALPLITNVKPPEADARACLERMLASPVFAQAERQKRFLRYLVEQTLAGRGEQIKGYTIAVEVFDRAPDFDPALDAIVRVQAGQLRAKLREYYEGDGRADRLRFELPKGSYAMRITLCSGPTLRESVESQSPQHQPASNAPSLRSPPARESLPFPKEENPQSALNRPAPILDKPSLVVLPFANMSSDPEQEYFADGITEDLTTELSRLSGLFVISRNSAFVYKGKPKRAEEIGAELGVRYLVEGSVRRASQQVRISAQLIDTATGEHLWAERYDRKLDDIFAVQDDVTERIVSVLRVKISHEEMVRDPLDETTDIAAHDFMLRARKLFFAFTPETSAEAKELYRKALAIDPNYARTYARLAGAHVRDWAMDWVRDRAVLDEALQHARKAIELAPTLPDAHAVYGWTQLWRREGADAIAAGRRAIALDQNNAEARLFLSLELVSCGHADEALAQIQLGMRLNPFYSPIHLNSLSLCYYALGDFEAAIAANERGIAMNPAFTPCLRVLVVLYARVGRFDDACRARETLMQRLGGARPVFSSGFFLDPELAARYERDRKAAWGE